MQKMDNMTTQLFEAAQTGNVKKCRSLLEKGARPYASGGTDAGYSFERPIHFDAVQKALKQLKDKKESAPIAIVVGDPIGSLLSRLLFTPTESMRSDAKALTRRLDAKHGPAEARKPLKNTR